MRYTLYITDWADRGPFAAHFYGNLYCDLGDRRQRIELEHRVRVNDPVYADDTLWRRTYKKKTYKTCRFATKTQILRAARWWFKKNAKRGDRLIYDWKTIAKA